MDMISLDAAVAITGISRSTLWRRVTDGRIGKGGKDARGRALLVLADVLPLAEVPLGAGDLPVLLQADAGAAEAQADMGALFYVAGAEKAALYWLNEAAAQGHADAMQWLGIAHYAASGGGRSLHTQEQEDNLALMWIARAAALGHPVARQQMAGLRPGRPGV